ncbi:MAG: DUF4258 domain-containing protein, partial [Planctomycetota bacterium]
HEVMNKIRNAVLDGRYIVTPHAWREMNNDNLVLIDIESVILSGTIDKEFSKDPRGVRYRVIGKTSDLSTTAAVIVRFVNDDNVLIITTFIIENDDG